MTVTLSIEVQRTLAHGLAIVDAMIVRGSLRRAFRFGPVSDAPTEQEPPQPIPPEWPSYWAFLRSLKAPECADILAAYTLGRDILIDRLADIIVDVADDGTNDWVTDDKGRSKVDWEVVNRSKLRVDTYKFLLSKLRPERYGERLDLTSKNKELRGGVIIVPAEEPTG